MGKVMGDRRQHPLYACCHVHLCRFTVHFNTCIGRVYLESYPALVDVSIPIELASQKVSTKVKAPRGTSDYQAVWIVESGGESDADEEDEAEDGEGAPSPKEDSEGDDEGEDDMVSEPAGTTQIT